MEKNPANGGKPAIASTEIKNVDERHRHPLLEPAHLAHVLLVMHGVDHAAGAEEQAGFEKRVGHQMENRRGIAADADADKHVTELAHGGIGENFLDVVLRQRDRGGDQRRGDADHGDHVEVSAAPWKRKHSCAPSCKRRR